MTINEYERVGELIKVVQRDRETIAALQECIEASVAEINLILKSNGENDISILDFDSLEIEPERVDSAKEHLEEDAELEAESVDLYSAGRHIYAYHNFPSLKKTTISYRPIVGGNL